MRLHIHMYRNDQRNEKKQWMYKNTYTCTHLLISVGDRPQPQVLPSPPWGQPVPGAAPHHWGCGWGARPSSGQRAGKELYQVRIHLQGKQSQLAYCGFSTFFVGINFGGIFGVKHTVSRISQFVGKWLHQNKLLSFVVLCWMFDFVESAKQWSQQKLMITLTEP